MTGKQQKPRGTFSFVGWPQWPDNEDYSFEFMRVLATAGEGASTVSECFWAARQFPSVKIGPAVRTHRSPHSDLKTVTPKWIARGDQNGPI